LGVGKIEAGLAGNGVRVTVGTPAESEAFLTAAEAAR
jgi:histidinol-phosphate/aromatic aminotransferase/cobyric acid decarboxylase-like protein